jgi:carbonic anhydrase
MKKFKDLKKSIFMLKNFVGSSWEKLLEGNKRFVSGDLVKKDFSLEKRKELLKGQKPYAVVIGCSDSRVPPEIIFDQGLGDIFVIRVAGNVLDPVSLGSIEYAVDYLKTPLIVILGHTHCGAVEATIHFHDKLGGNLKAIAEKIMPAVAEAKKIAMSDEDLLNKAIEENVKLQKEFILGNSRVIQEYVKANKVQIIMAIYDMETGEVKIIK